MAVPLAVGNDDFEFKPERIDERYRISGDVTASIESPA